MDHTLSNTVNEVLRLLDEAYANRIHDLNLSADLATKALFLSRELNDKALIGKSLNHLSLFYMILGAYDKSIAMAEEAIQYFEELDDEKGIADARYSIAGNYYKTDNYHLGLIYLINCLGTYQKYDDYHNQARTQKSLGTIYEYFGDQKNAIKSYEGAIAAAKKAKDISLESNAYNPLSGIYLKQNKIKEALELIEQSIEMKNQSGDTRGLAFALYGRGKVYIKTGDFDKAEADLQQSLSIHHEVGEKLGAGMSMHRLAYLYTRMGRLADARTVLMKALEFSDTYNIVIIKFKCNQLLYQISKLENDTVNALKYLEDYLQQKEAVINTQTLQIIENYELIKRMEYLEQEAKAQKERDEILQKKERAEQTAKVKQDFLSTMSHELRTPLNAVITITSLLKDKSDEEDQRLLNSLKFASNNLLLIINDILDFTKLDSGKMKLENKACNFSGLLDNMRHIYDNMAAEKGLRLVLTTKGNMAESYELDETKISQILSNLVGNAIKYTDAGQVEISVELVKSAKKQHVLRFKVSDTGIGIPRSFFAELFDSFTQPRSVTTRKQGGSGLGLAIVKKLIELHGSKVHVKSEVGKGSTFYFDLKLKPVVKSETARPLALEQLQNKYVLLAEDNPINAMVARKLLSNWGISSDHARDGAEAVLKAGEKAFDFILMDIHMPEMNGFDAAKQIRETVNHNSATPIFALTADITAEHQEDYFGYFNGFLRKPIEIDKLYHALSVTATG